MLRQLAGLAFFPLPVLAGDPYCNVLETCTVTSDNCRPAAGRLVMTLRDDGKAVIELDDRAPQVSTVLSFGGQITMIFGEGGEEHQLRIAPDGRFNYLISTPNPDAWKGKDQILYRGQCVEG